MNDQRLVPDSYSELRKAYLEMSEKNRIVAEKNTELKVKIKLLKQELEEEED
jgi:hypothetical protein